MVNLYCVISYCRFRDHFLIDKLVYVYDACCVQLGALVVVFTVFSAFGGIIVMLHGSKDKREACGLPAEHSCIKTKPEISRPTDSNLWGHGWLAVDKEGHEFGRRVPSKL